ncbi:MAG: hypothetical protein K0Q95_681 [Bacteroidota bacterium]|jgi:tetratricopeptide (TPR) repeat protein|nr:hypothetical protein [Bacteroidota bacterium]
MQKIYLFFRQIVFALCLLTTLSTYAKVNPADSLTAYLKTTRPDSVRVKTLNALGKSLEFSDQKLSRHYLLEALKLADSIGYEPGKGYSYKFLGYLAEDISELDSGIYFYNKAYEIFIKTDKSQAADMLKLIGDAYSDKGEYSTAMSYFQKSLKMFESIESIDGMAAINYSLGQLYQGLLQNEKAMAAYKKSLELYEKVRQPVDIANALTAVGIIYNTIKEHETAKEYYQKAKIIYEELQYDNGLSNLYTWMAITAYDEKNIDGALEYFKLSLELYKKINNVNGLIYCYNNIGSIYADKKDYDKAIEWEKKSLEMAIETKGLEYIKYSHEMLAHTYSKKGDYSSAFHHLTEFMKYKDSIFNETSMKQIHEMQTKYETEKKDKELLRKDAEILKQTAIADKQATQRNYFIIGFGLMLILSLFIFRSYRQKQKANAVIALQKEKVEKQKELIEEKQKEILDSIHYAERIQRSLLPTEIYIDKNLQRLKQNQN